MEIDGQWKNIILELETLSFFWRPVSVNQSCHIMEIQQHNLFQDCFSCSSPRCGNSWDPHWAHWEGRKIWTSRSGYHHFFRSFLETPLCHLFLEMQSSKFYMFECTYAYLSIYMMFLQTSWKHECVEPQIRCRQLKPECLFDGCRFFFKM